MRAISLRCLVPDVAPPETLYGLLTLMNFEAVTGHSYHDQSIRVTLNGEEIDKVTELDDIAGWVACYEPHPYFARLTKVRRYGTVRLTFEGRL